MNDKYLSGGKGLLEPLKFNKSADILILHTPLIPESFTSNIQIEKSTGEVKVPYGY